MLGLGTPAAGAAAAGTMAVAASMHKDNGFFAQDGGYEYPAMLGLTAAALALGGPGQLSLDAALGHRANRQWMRRRRRSALSAASETMSSGQSASSELPESTH